MCGGRPMEGKLMLSQPEVQIIEYPESDGLPMAETGFHVTIIAFFLAMLRQFFHARSDVYVGANMFMYYEKDDPNQRKAPDLFVVFGTTNEERRVWRVWEEKRVPAVIFELTSRSTRTEDKGDKKKLYQRLGVQEYFLFDPLQEYLKPPLQGFRLERGLYRPIKAERGVGFERQLSSAGLGLWLRLESDMLNLYDQETGRKLLPPLEMAAALREAEARLQAEIQAHQVAEARLRDEIAARQTAEAELARLRAEYEQLRKGDPE
jgi:Uma2 family endonuclease